MKRKRIAAVALFGVALLAMAAEPVAAQESTTDRLISNLNQELLFVAVPITLLVEGILIYTVVRFTNNDEPKPTRENRRLEITWTIATAVILLFVGVGAYNVMGAQDVITTDQAEPQPEDTEINVTAQKYYWTFEYEDENVIVDSNQGQLVIPANEKVYFEIGTADWLHAFHVPDLGLKQDAVPGQQNVIRTEATNPGNTYQGYCAEYCGQGHSRMLFEVQVVTQEEFEQWLEEQRSEDS
ncbi:cytochrome c oxidase subunit II [Halobacteriales archaeon QS_9_68_17]|nr:MAG: cytochrome c oxidase subunit II [Halobacteriales archaeon QS_9_68_17]